MAMIRNRPPSVDLTQALVLAETYAFEPAILYAYTELGRHHDLLSHHMRNGQFEQALRTCELHGDRDGSLWVAALGFFVSRPEPFEREISGILRVISERRLLTPIMVLQLIARNPKKPLGVAREYLLKALQNDEAAIAHDREEIARYCADTAIMKNELASLQAGATVLKEIVCHRCGDRLSLPAVHFLCMHSYHQHCLVDSAERECPICAPEMHKVSELKEQLALSVTHHDRFHKHVEATPDGFSVIADYFGRGAFDPAILQMRGQGLQPQAGPQGPGLTPMHPPGGSRF